MYFGPYSVECLSTMWANVTCLPEGTGHPSKLSAGKIGYFTGLGLRFVVLIVFILASCIIKGLNSLGFSIYVSPDFKKNSQRCFGHKCAHIVI